MRNRKAPAIALANLLPKSGVSKENSCDGKVQYATLKEANRARGSLQGAYGRYGNQRFVAYICNFGSHWHVGHVVRG